MFPISLNRALLLKEVEGAAAYKLIDGTSKLLCNMKSGNMTLDFKQVYCLSKQEHTY